MPSDLPETIYNGQPMSAESDELDKDSLAAYELTAIRNALIKSDGHRKKAAHILGIGEATLYRKLSKYKIS